MIVWQNYSYKAILKHKTGFQNGKGIESLSLLHFTIRHFGFDFGGVDIPKFLIIVLLRASIDCIHKHPHFAQWTMQPVLRFAFTPVNNK